MEIAGRGCAVLCGCLQQAEEGRRRRREGRAEIWSWVCQVNLWAVAVLVLGE